MLTNIIRGEYVTDVRYELAFDDGHGNGYGLALHGKLWDSSQARGRAR